MPEQLTIRKVGKGAVRIKRLKKLGGQGGKKTLKRYGRNHFSMLAAKRKHCRGGRPKKNSKPIFTRS